MIRSLVSATQGPEQKGERWLRTRSSKLSLCHPLTAHLLPGLRLTLPASPRGARGQAHTARKPPGVPCARLTVHKPLGVPGASLTAHKPPGVPGIRLTAHKPPGVPGTRLTARKPLRVPRARCEAGRAQQWFPK